MSGRDPVQETAEERDAGPRAILRVPETLTALAARTGGATLSDLARRLNVPKSSLHRLLRTLARGGYVTSRDGLYRLGPSSFHMAGLIARRAPGPALPELARPVVEWLARESQETVMLGELCEQDTQIRYADVVDSPAAVRFTIPVGDLRPLYCAASGKAVFPFLPPEARRAYLATTRFECYTPRTAGHEDLQRLANDAEAAPVAFDRDGRIVGASGVASPFFGAEGRVRGSVSVAGPTDRILAGRQRLEVLVRQAGERISQLLGYVGTYPPRP